MNDDLERILSQPPRPRRAAAEPCVRVGPGLQGGLPLDRGPQLDVVPDATPATAAPRQFHAAGRPHLSLRPAEREADRAAADIAERSDAPRIFHGACQLSAIGLHKSYRKGAVTVPVLRGVDMGVRPGEFLAIVGQSGSGKSTLLHLLGTLDAPDRGEIHFDGRRIDNLAASRRDVLRNRRFGMIFQFYHLLPELTTLENVLMPMMIARRSWAFFRHRREYRAAAAGLLDIVGLGHRLKHKPRELSGGEMQRAAIARALVTQPDLLLADEPTGNLDQDTGRDIIRILRTLNRQQTLTIVMVTHDPAIAAQADRVVRLVSGRIE